MNDTPTTQSAKQDAVALGMKIFERIEKGFDQLHDLLQQGLANGMMDITECHELQNKALELKYATLGFHCRCTAIAKRNKCDVPGGGVQPAGGPGR